MADVCEKMKEMGITLPVPPPKGGVYTPVMELATISYTAQAVEMISGTENTCLERWEGMRPWNRGSRRPITVC